MTAKTVLIFIFWTILFNAVVIAPYGGKRKSLRNQTLALHTTSRSCTL